MQKFSYINQMNGFLTRMSDDALPANAVMLYLILFNRFNRSCWRQEWMKFTLQQLMAFSHIGSPNTVYSMRSLLKELGYIDYRPSRNGSRSQTEYRLLPLTSATDMPQAPANVLSHNEPAKNENTQRGFSPELSKSENSETETSNEFSPELSKSENHRHELSKNEYRTPPVCAKSEYSKTETSKLYPLCWTLEMNGIIHS